MTREEISRNLEISVRSRKDLPGTVTEELAPEVVRFDDTVCLLRFPVCSHMRNVFGVMHGGMIAGMLDTAMGIWSVGLSGSVPMTVSMSFNCIRPVPLDQGPILAEARARRIGKTISYMEAVLLQEEGGEPFAEGTASYIMSPPLKPVI